MNIEQQKLSAMLSENKISNEDYQLLLTAMERQNARQSIFPLFINPFQKIAGYKALGLGLIMIAVMSYIGVAADVYFTSILDCLNAANMKHMQVLRPYFTLLLSQNMINWLVLSATFILAAVIFRQKRIRVVDFLGTVALARFPYLILTALIAIVWIINPSLLNFDLTKTTTTYDFSLSAAFIDFMWQFCYAWQITTYFFALKESSGLTGNKLWIGFFIALFTAEQISHALGMYLMWV